MDSHCCVHLNYEQLQVARRRCAHKHDCRALDIIDIATRLGGMSILRATIIRAYFALPMCSIDQQRLCVFVSFIIAPHAFSEDLAFSVVKRGMVYARISSVEELEYHGGHA